MSPYALGLELTLLLACWLCLAVWQKDPATPGRRTFVLLALAGATWCFGELACERDLLDEAVGVRIKYAGLLCVPPLWIGAAAHAARLEVASRLPWFPLVLLAPLCFVYALLYSSSWGGLFLTVIPGGDYFRGPLWWVTALYNYALVVTGSGILILSAFRWRPAHWVQQLALGLAACALLATNVAYVATGMKWLYDPTPVLLGIALLALRSVSFSGGLLELLPISQHEVVQQLPWGVLLIDRHGTVISANPEAERRLGTSAEEALGRDLDAVLEAADEPLRIETVPLKARDQEAGQIVLIGLPSEKRKGVSPSEAG